MAWSVANALQVRIQVQHVMKRLQVQLLTFVTDPTAADIACCSSAAANGIAAALQPPLPPSTNDVLAAADADGAPMAPLTAGCATVRARADLHPRPTPETPASRQVRLDWSHQWP